MADAGARGGASLAISKEELTSDTATERYGGTRGACPGPGGETNANGSFRFSRVRSAMAEERPCGVDRTLVLLDADLPSLTVRDALLGVDKSSQALAIEAVTEYTRIFYDLFPSALLCVCVGAVTTASNEPVLQRLNLWAPQRQQSLQRVTEQFSIVQFASSKSEKQAEEGEVEVKLLHASLRSALALLIEGEEKRTTTLRTRKEEDAELITIAADSVRALPSEVLCELVLVSLSAKPVSSKRANVLPKAVNPSLLVVRHECPIEQLTQFTTTRLARDHFGLRQVVISGIPMKDTNVKEGDRIISTVTILHPSSAHSPLAPDAFSSANETVLHWRTVDKRANVFNLPAYCTHRVTPLLVNGKPVLLSGSEDATKPPSHLLLVTGGEVWLHCLQGIPAADALPPAALAAYGRRTNEYRVENFAQVISSNILYPPPAKKKNRSMLSSYFRLVPTAQLLAAAAVPPAVPKTPTSSASPPAVSSVATQLAQLDAATVPYITTKHLERATRYYPMIETDTILCAHEQSPALCSFVDPLRTTFMSEATDEAQTSQAIETLQRLQQYAVQNEPSLFPPLVNNLVARQEAYKRLWLELLVLARRSARLNAVGNHGKIVTAMERLWPELSGVAEQREEDKEKDKSEKDKMKIEPSVGAGIGADGELSKRAIQELQMLRDREREREEEEKKVAATNAAAAIQLAGGKGGMLGKRDRDRDRDRTGVGRHKDLDTPQDDAAFFAAPLQAPSTPVMDVKREAKGKDIKDSGGGMKLALRRKRNLISEQHARTVYGIYWSAVQAKRAPVRDFDGRADEQQA